MALKFLPDVDEKRARILNAALAVFAQYGYRRASMEDIAKAAGISRAAVYQHFRNKEDVLVQGVDAFFDITAADLRDALVPDVSLREAVRAGCAAIAGQLAEALLESPHGEELVSMHNGEAADAKRRGEARIGAIWADWLAAQSDAGRITLSGQSPEAVAQTILAGQMGQKLAADSYSDYVNRLDLFADLIARALKP